MSLLSIVQSVALRAGIPKPVSVVSSNDLTVNQLQELAQESIEELSKVHGWRRLRVPYTFTTVASMAQDSTSLPADFGRMAEGQTAWNQTQRLPLMGPASADDWAKVVALNLVVGPRLAFRLIGTVMYLYPAPSAGQTIYYEYISNKPILDVDGSTRKTTWAADTDTSLIPETLVVQDLRWRWKAAKGLSYAEEMATFERALEKEAAADRGYTEISMSQNSADTLPPNFWPTQIGP